MLQSSAPIPLQTPFGANADVGYVRTVPVASQIAITPGAASFTDGFPPINFVDPKAGGVPFSGQDVNGVLNAITKALQWEQLHGSMPYSALVSAAIGGYPNGAVLKQVGGYDYWQSTVDNNATNPDTGGAGWQAIAGGQLSGFRNKLINCNFTPLQVINQRASAARNTTNAAYNFDRWYYESGGTKLTQAIESLSLKESTVHVINWSGTATCEYIQSASAMATVTAAGGWTAIAKGATLTTSATTVSAGLHLFIRFLGVDATLATLDKPQVEEGTLATPCEQPPYGYVLNLCRRYTRTYPNGAYFGSLIGQSTTTAEGSWVSDLRVAPTVGGTYTLVARTGGGAVSCSIIAATEFYISIALSAGGVVGQALTVNIATGVLVFSSEL